MTCGVAWGWVPFYPFIEKLKRESDPRFSNIRNFVFTGVDDTGDNLLAISLTPLIKPCPGFSSIL